MQPVWRGAPGPVTFLREVVLEASQDEKSKANQREKLNNNTQAATKHIVLDEALTRILIDQQLTEAGWQADSEELTYKNGIRPEKGKTYNALMKL